MNYSQSIPVKTIPIPPIINPNIPQETKFVPIRVKIIAVLYYISATLGLIFGLLFIVSAGLVNSITNQIPILGLFGTGLFIIGAIIIIVLGILSFFIGRGLWKGRNWARILVVIFSFISVLIAIVSMIQGNILSNIITLVISLVIGGYLLFSNNVKETFA